MAQNVFVRGGAPPPTGGAGVYSKGYGRRPNGTASVGVGGGGSSSPFLATGAGQGRPDTILNYAKIILEGDAGALTRAEFQATAYTSGAFNGIINGDAGIGKPITVTVGGVSKEVTVYKHSFSNDKTGKWTVTVTGVGKGLELMKKDVAGNNPGGGQDFYKNGVWESETTKATSFLDIIAHQIFKACKTNPFSAALDHGNGVPGKFVLFMAPSNLQASGDAGGTTGLIGFKNALYYVTLGHLITEINNGLAGGMFDMKYLKAGSTETSLPGGIPLISADPVRVLIPLNTVSDYGSPADAGVVGMIKSILGVPNTISTSTAQVADMGDGDCKKIMISMSALMAIMSNLSTGNQDTAAKKAADAASPGTRLDIEGFFSALFGLIKESTGGFIDLIVMNDPDTAAGNPNPCIVNMKNKETEVGSTVYDDVSGEGGVRSATFSGDIPQGIQAEAFANGSVAGDPGVKSAKAPTPADITDAKNKLVQSGYSDTGAIGGVLRKALADAPVGDLVSKSSKAYPIGLSLTINGTAGIEFGHAIAMTSLSGTNWANNTAFTVTRVTHTVQNQDWTTQIQTVARLVG
jgi:hypothetical protein